LNNSENHITDRKSLFIRFDYNRIYLDCSSVSRREQNKIVNEWNWPSGNKNLYYRL